MTSSSSFLLEIILLVRVYLLNYTLFALSCDRKILVLVLEVGQEKKIGHERNQNIQIQIRGQSWRLQRELATEGDTRDVQASHQAQGVYIRTESATRVRRRPFEQRRGYRLKAKRQEVCKAR